MIDLQWLYLVGDAMKEDEEYNQNIVELRRDNRTIFDVQR